MIEAKNIGYFYGREMALENIDLSVKKGEFIALVGSSGSGKSTLLATLSTLLQPSDGIVTLMGQETNKITDIDRFRQDNIGFVFQFHYLINYLNAYENITLSATHRDKEYIHYLTQKLGIEKLLKKYPNEISGGERQRVAIARALVNRPKIIFADEPTGNLDSHNSDIVFAILKETAKENGVSVVVATHDTTQAQKADTIYRMNDGHISKNAQ
jgi:putative ABC transport system ATP-binding protein